MTTQTKPAVRSRTLWFNGIVALLVAAEASLHLIKPHFPDEALYGTALFVIILGNAALRVVTTQGITK